MRFKLPGWFLWDYFKKAPNFGFGKFSEIVYYQYYSRIKENGCNECWAETVQRVVEGTYQMQLDHLISIGMEEHWDESKAINSAMNMYERMFDFYWLPAGRGLWSMGTPLTEQKKYCALNSCTFVSTEEIDKTVDPFVFVMDLLMFGVGVGFDCKGAKKVTIKSPIKHKITIPIYTIPDSREGWVTALRYLLMSYFYGYDEVNFNYCLIRPRGSPLKTFGGTAAGPDPLEEMLEAIRSILHKNIGKKITNRIIVDIMNLIAKCVIVGNRRRSALLGIGPENEEFLNLKNYDKNPERADFGWASNNSIDCKLGSNYKDISERIVENGEPGVIWLENIQGFGRMNGIRDDKDKNATGCNPCVEQTLESYEMCCLVETFPNNHTSLEDYLETLKYAFLYGKTVTLGESHWEKTNDVLLRNRRIGLSMSGITQFLTDRGLDVLQDWCEEGYDKIQEFDNQYSEWLNIPNSIKTTSVKPSGTVSILAGATPGIHFPESEFYIRRIRLQRDCEFVKQLKEAGFKVEQDLNTEDNCVIEFPISLEGTDPEKKIKTSKEASIFEKISLAAFMQENWSDNQVSCTVTFDEKTEGPLVEEVLDEYQYKLKGISFLPVGESYPFPQMPYEEITREEYYEMKSKINENFVFDFNNINEEPKEEQYCSNDTCTIEGVIN